MVITKDEDFARMALVGGSSPHVGWIRVGKTVRRELLRWFEPMIEHIVAMVDEGYHVSSNSAEALMSLPAL